MPQLLTCYFPVAVHPTLRIHSEAGASSSEVFTEEKLIADCKLPILHVLAVIYDGLAIFGTLSFSSSAISDDEVQPSLPMLEAPGRLGLKALFQTDVGRSRVNEVSIQQ